MPIQTRSQNHQVDTLCQYGKAVVRTEARAIAALEAQINPSFAQACHLILSCAGRVVVVGMGKSGHIAHKIAATLASTGTPAFFVHPGEACHGDMGMITTRDVVLLLSNSGETPEILTLLPLLKHLQVELITITGNPRSTLAQASTINLSSAVTEEACPLDLAPTASTTAALVLGDALAIALLQARGFTSEDFALAHPGGMLGRRLLLKIRDIMRTGKAVPRVLSETPLVHTILEMTAKHVGMTTVTDTEGHPVGVFTDGDLRRALHNALNLQTTSVSEVMTRDFKTTHSDTLAVTALHYMETYKITSLVVLNEDGTLEGIVHMHDLLNAKLA